MKKKIIFVDDDFNAIELNKQVLNADSYTCNNWRPKVQIEFYLKELLNHSYDVSLIKKPSIAISYFKEPRPDVYAIILDIQMPTDGLPWPDRLTTGRYVLRRVLEYQCQSGLRTTPLPIAVLTNGTDPSVFNDLKSEMKTNYPSRLWISNKQGAGGPNVAAWLANFESWLEDGTKYTGV